MSDFENPVEYLEQLSVEVVNNQFNDQGKILFDQFFAVWLSFCRCGVFKDMNEYDRADLIFRQLYELIEK